jgi:FixJ family two-component response regulator
LLDAINWLYYFATDRSERLGGRMMRIADGVFRAQYVRVEKVQNIRTHATVESIRVAVVEDDDRMRQALAFQVATAGFKAAAFASAEEFLKVPGANQFDCIVADIFLPRMNGLQLQEEVDRTVPYASIVFITGHGDLSLGMHAMRKGAVDFFEKPVNDEALLTAITRGVELSRSRRAEHAQRIEFKERHGSLTSRECEVFALITTGLLNKQVGAQLGITERTVKAHREKVMHKMGADSLADLVQIAGSLQIHANQRLPA